MLFTMATRLIINHGPERAEIIMWFQKKKKPPAKPPAATAPAPAPAPAPAQNAASIRSEASSSLSIQQLEKRLKKLEEELSQLSSKHPQIHIDNVHIHQPVLDNLTFRLDALDIKELSGSLNLGNNFGTKPNEKTGLAGEVLKQAQRSTAGASPTSSENEQAAGRRPEPAHQPGTGSNPGPSPERTTTGYRYTPQSKTK